MAGIIELALDKLHKLVGYLIVIRQVGLDCLRSSDYWIGDGAQLSPVVSVAVEQACREAKLPEENNKRMDSGPVGSRPFVFERFLDVIAV